MKPFLRMLPSSLAVAAAAAVILSTVHRVHFGLHFEDEAVYVAWPWRLILGDRVFVDDLDVRQISSFLTYPFVRAYTWLNGGTDGLILFTRLLYVTYTVLIGSVTFCTFRRDIHWTASLFTALIGVAYAPFNIYNLSYNTMGAGFLVAALFLAIGGTDATGRSFQVRLFLSGAAFALSIVCYPTFAIVWVPFGCFLAWFVPRPKLRGLAAFCVGTAAVGVPIAMVLLGAGVTNVLNAIEFTRSWGTQAGAGTFGTLKKLRVLRSQLEATAPCMACVGGVLAAMLLSSRRLPALTLLLTPVLGVLSFAPGLYRSMAFVIYFSIIGPFFAACLWREALVRRLFVLGWVPSVLAGAVGSWTSNNGLPNAAVGLLPACLITCVLAVLWTSRHAQAVRFEVLRGLGALTPIVAVACVVYFQYADRVYWDQPIPSLAYRVQTGPFRGLFTSAEKFALLRELSTDLPLVVNSTGQILFYPDFAAGYLMTTMRPASAHLWVGGLYGFHAQWYAQKARPQNVVVRLRRPPRLGRRPNELDAVVFAHHRPVISKSRYVILTGDREESPK